MRKFPQTFLWGAATSAYQVEGNNSNADWWAWEKKAGKEQSGAACRHYELYEQDFDLIKSLHHNAYRLSVEWARIEPSEDTFDQKEIQHYLDVIKSLRARGIEPLVTLHHFTNPIWFSASGGWEKRNAVERFRRYVEVVVKALSPYVRYWITINEPTIIISHAHLFGAWPPQEKSFLKCLAVYGNMLKGHVEAYRTIHSIYREANLPKPAVSIAQHMMALVPCTPSLRNRWAVKFRDAMYNFKFIDDALYQEALDYIGVNYYSRQLVDLRGIMPGNFVWDVCCHNHAPLSKNALGWDIYPQGLYEVLTKAGKYDLPIIITENGICTSDDNVRVEFIRAHLSSVHRAMSEGVKVEGYMYWSLMDNFEWDKGFAPRFGIIEIDYATAQRTARPSALKYADICRTGSL